MSVKEKLVELLKPNYPCDYEDCEDCPRFNDESACLLRLKEVLADHLIANGVTIEAEPVKHGRWVVKNGRIVCDQCGALWSICPERKQQEEHLKHVYETEKFCYTCGAKMDLDNPNCSSYHTEHGKPVCYGTKEKEECTCEGNRKNCNFYKEYREE